MLLNYLLRSHFVASHQGRLTAVAMPVGCESVCSRKFPSSSYVLCKGAKVNHANGHLLCSVCFFCLFFFSLCKSELSCACVELV